MARDTSSQSRARSRLPLGLVVAGVLLVVIIACVAYLSGLEWRGSHPSPVATWILRIVIIGGPIPIVLNVLSFLCVVFLLVRRPTKRRVIVAMITVLTSALIALIVFWVSTATNAFGLTLSNVIGAWAVVSFVSIALAIVSFAGASWWRKVGNVAVITIVLLAAIVGVNANFGLDPTIAALAGVSTQPVIVLPLTRGETIDPARQLWSRWKPPVGMPAVGRTAQVSIPGIVSRFPARPAGIYLPPAALVKDPPALPLVIMMMGQPGNPDPAFQAQVLDRLAAKNRGLAPIVIVADQIGNPSVDTLCMDTKAHGNAHTYIVRDVVHWARTHLHIDQDPAHWVIAGYSNGGECAAQLGATYPNVWGNVIDIAGEEYEGWQMRAQTAMTYFHGDWPAYAATWPASILASHRYANSAGVFAVGSNDPIFRPQTLAVRNAARAANWATCFTLIHNGGHGEGVLIGGLQRGFKFLYARLGLSAPIADWPASRPDAERDRCWPPQAHRYSRAP